MTSRKFSGDHLANTKPGGSCEKAAFGTKEPERGHFGRDSSPHFGRPGALTKDARGVAAIEYAILCSVIALAILAALTRLGHGVEKNWNSVGNEVGKSIEFQT